MKTAIYDFQVSPYSYDFVQFLACASNAGAEQVIFVSGERGWSKLTPEQERSRFERLLLPLAKAWGEYRIAAREDASYEDDIVWPNRYRLDEPTAGHQLGYAVRSRRFKSLKASPEAMEWAEPMRGSIIITLRRSPARPERNSRLKEWLRAADMLMAAGYRVVIVPDTECTERYPDYDVCQEAAESLDKRLALYSVAGCNLGVNNGPMSLLIYSKRPYLLFNYGVEEEAHATAAYLTRQGLPPGSQYPFWKPNQRIIWETDTAANIYNGFKLWEEVQRGERQWPPHVIPAMMVKGASDEAQRWENAKHSMSLVTKRLDVIPPHKGTLSICAFGPSLKDTWEHAAGGVIMTVSGALDFLTAQEVSVRFHVECDPREHKARFLERPQDFTNYLIASSCHPKMFANLEGCDVYLWHAEINAEFFEWLKTADPTSLVVGGGTNAGVLAIQIGIVLGYRNFELHGYDCSFTPSDTHAGEHYGKKQARMKVNCGGREFITSPALVQGARDILALVSSSKELNIVMHGDGLLQAMAVIAMQPKEIANA